MGTGSEDGDQPGAEDFEHFMEIRRHVKRMQAGTPILLRTLDGAGQEELQICTFWVTSDLQLLKWRDQEGSNVVRELPISTIADVAEDSADSAAAAAAQEDAHHALTLVLNADEAAGSQVQLPRTMGLICASPEDLASWRDGLKFLVGASPPPPQGDGDGAAAAASGRPSSPESDGDLRRQLRKQAEAMERLRKENEMLREMVRRKDTTIAQLLRDLQGRPIPADRSIKTESTSRESDDHLRDREVAILQRKNRRLQKALRAKQQTLGEVLQMLGRVTQQQGAESSAVEDVGKDDEDDSDSDVSPAPVGNSGSVGGDPVARPLASADAQRQRVRIAATQRADPGTASDGEMLEALEALRQRSKMQSAASRAAAPFRPPPRADAGEAPPKAAPPAKAAAPAPAKAAPEPAAAAAAVPSPSPSPSSQRFIPATLPKAASPTPQSPQRAAAAPEQMFKVVRPDAPVPGRDHVGSQAALQALSRELALLEEKKRVVEQLARRLEPPSDGEEDDGFPLR